MKIERITFGDFPKGSCRTIHYRIAKELAIQLSSAILTVDERGKIRYSSCEVTPFPDHIYTYYGVFDED